MQSLRLQCLACNVRLQRVLSFRISFLPAFWIGHGSVEAAFPTRGSLPCLLEPFRCWYHFGSYWHQQCCRLSLLSRRSLLTSLRRVLRLRLYTTFIVFSGSSVIFVQKVPSSLGSLQKMGSSASSLAWESPRLISGSGLQDVLRYRGAWP